MSIFYGLLPLSLTALAAFGSEWSATVEVNHVKIPFRMAIEGTTGWFYNGDERVIATSGARSGDHLTLQFAQYGSVLQADLSGGILTGTYDRGSRGIYPFRAVSAKESVPSEAAPRIAGDWEMVATAKPEAAWQLVVRQNGPSISAAILRIDGDTGTLTGAYHNGIFRFSHFSGARPLLVDARLQDDGSLAMVLNEKDHYRAVRAEHARAANLPAPAESFQHTSFLHPEQPFPFRFPDLRGNLVANTDARFQGKVVLVAISGSWCPNCHDEAPFLESLYHKYQRQGLEIVALSFEEGDQLKNPERLRAFIKEYGVDYTVLLAGDPADLTAKLPQAKNLDSWPTTVFLGRDGRVRGVHSGFAGHATGRFYDEQTAEMKALIEKLLHEKAPAGQ